MLDPISSGVLILTMLTTRKTLEVSVKLASTTKCRQLKLASMLLLMFSKMDLTMEIDGQFTAHFKAKSASKTMMQAP